MSYYLEVARTLEDITKLAHPVIRAGIVPLPKSLVTEQIVEAYFTLGNARFCLHRLLGIIDNLEHEMHMLGIARTEALGESNGDTGAASS